MSNATWNLSISKHWVRTILYTLSLFIVMYILERLLPEWKYTVEFIGGYLAACIYYRNKILKDSL